MNPEIAISINIDASELHDALQASIASGAFYKFGSEAAKAADAFNALAISDWEAACTQQKEPVLRRAIALRGIHWGAD